jgi:hypothetical protein
MTIEKAFEKLEIKDHSIIIRMREAPNYEIAKQVIEDLHSLVRRQRKLLSKKYHPDIGGDEEKLKIINNVCDKLLNINVQIVQPQPVYYHTVIIRTDYGNTTATTTSGWWS